MEIEKSSARWSEMDGSEEQVEAIMDDVEREISRSKVWPEELVGNLIGWVIERNIMKVKEKTEGSWVVQRGS